MSAQILQFRRPSIADRYFAFLCADGRFSGYEEKDMEPFKIACQLWAKSGSDQDLNGMVAKRRSELQRELAELDRI